MNRIKVYLLCLLIFTGCQNPFKVNQRSVNLSFIEKDECQECQECEVCEECPSDTKDSLDASLWDITDRIDTSDVILNHYIDGDKFEENIADVIEVNNKIGTKNIITLPPYDGKVIEHTIIVQFKQIK